MAEDKQKEILGIDDVLGVAQRVPVLVTGYAPYDYTDKGGNQRKGKGLCVGVASLEPGAPHQGFVCADVMCEGDDAAGVTTAPAFYTAVVTTKKAYGKLQQFFAEFRLLARVEAAGLGPRKGS